MQAAINAARSQLPANLPQNPSYRKANPADSPILILTLTSDVVPKPQIYDMADSILAQKISQVQGVGQVFVGGSASPAVRVEVNPMQLGNNGVGLEAVRTALANANANRPKGAFQDATHRWAITDNDQIFKASDYAPIIAGYNRRPARRCASPTWAQWPTALPNILTGGVAGINPDKGPPGKVTDAILLFIFKSPGRQRDVDRGPADGGDAASAGLHSAHHQDQRGQSTAPSPSAPACTTWRSRSSSAWCWWCWWSSCSCARCGPPSFRRSPCRSRWWAPSA